MAELPYQTYERLTGKKWSPETRGSAYSQYGITAPAGSAEANLALQKAMLATPATPTPTPTITEKGAVTSEQGRADVESAQGTSPVTTQTSATSTTLPTEDPLQKEITRLTGEISGLQSKLTTSEKNLQEAQASGSISQQRINALKQIQAGATTKTEIPTADGTAEVGGVGEADTTNPLVKAYTDHANETITATADAMANLAQYTKDVEADTEATVNSINALATAQIARVTKENERLTQAAEVTNIRSGRAQYNPTEHLGIVSEVIQDGLARIAKIELEAQENVLQQKRALRDFKYKSFVDLEEKRQGLIDLKLKTFTDINKALVDEETRAREAIKFDQEQDDRMTLILAEELVNATPEQIQKSATANGLSAGALSKAVNDAKYKIEKEGLDIEGKKLDIEGKKLDIAKTSAEIAEIKGGRRGGKEMNSADRTQFKEITGWMPPNEMSADQAYAIHNGLGLVLEPDQLQIYATKFMSGGDLAMKYYESIIGTKLESVKTKLNKTENADLKEKFENAGDDFFGIFQRLKTWGEYKQVLETEEFKNAYMELAKKQEQEGGYDSDTEFLMAVINKTIENMTESKKQPTEARKKAGETTIKTKTSTPAIIY